MRVQSLVRLFWWSFAALSISIALLFTAARMLFPYVEDYRSDVEGEVSRLLEHPVRIATLHARWSGLSPQVVLSDVRLLDPADKQALLQIKELQIGLSLWQSLLQQRIAFGKVTAILDNLSLIRARDGRLLLQGYQSPDSRINARELADWILHQGHLGIRSQQISLHDEVSGRHHHFVKASIDLRNHAGHHLLEGALSLPAPQGQDLAITANINGNPLDGKNWYGQIELNGKDISPQYWFTATGWQPPIELRQGRINFKLGSLWKNAVLSELNGDINGQGLMLGRRGNPSGYAADRIASTFHLQRKANEWQLALTNLGLERAGHHWPNSQLNLDYLGTDTAGTPRINAEGNYLHISDISEALRTLLPAGHKLRPALDGLRPFGELGNWHVSNDKQGYAGQVQFTQAGVDAWQAFPSLKNLSGQLDFSHTGGKLTVSSQRALFEWPRMFRWPIGLNRLQGTLEMRRQANGWLLSSQQFQLGNEDLQTASNIKLLFPSDPKASPHLNISSGFTRGDGRQVSRYLPVGIMTPDLVEWLDTSLQGGTVPQGTLVVQGAASDFPYAEGNGKFEVNFDARQIQLLPNPGWPLIENINGQVRFFGNSMEILAQQGRIFSSTLSNTKVAIADMTLDIPILTINGVLAGPTAEKLRYLNESPLRERYSDIVTSLAPSGDSRLDLALAIGLAEGAEDHIRGKVTLQNNRLRVIPAKLDFTGINGELQLSDQGLQAKDITGYLYRHPLSVDILRHTGQQATLLEAHGRADADGLRSYFQHPIFGHFNGTSAWQAKVMLPDGAAPISLDITSPLIGMSVDLLSPFSKGSKETRKLAVRSEFGNNRLTLLNLDYGDLMSGTFQLLEGGDIERGQILFGQGTPKLPDLPGLSIAGKFNRLSVSEWEHLLQQTDQATTAKNGNQGMLATLRTVDLNINHFEMFQQPFDNLKITATRMAEQWLMRVESPQMSGKITLQEDLLEAPVQMDLEYWRMHPLGQATTPAKTDEQAFDMAKLPSLQINCKAFSYDNMTLGRLELQGQRRNNGYRIERVELTPPQTRISLRGDWSRYSKGEQTRMEATVETRDAGRTMAALGYADTIREGKGQIQMNLKWPGSPLQPEMSRSNGKLTFRIDKGRLLDVDPGAGRILGLLSLQALPRRLTLDFTDMFSKGMAFDYIEGMFDISGGIATTNNMHMESPAAGIDITGKVDLAHQRYDQRVAVTPYATESLPLLGALTAATPQIGAAIFVAQQLFKKTLRKLTRFEYTITGPWDNPKIERLGSKKEKSRTADAPMQ